MTNSGSKTVKKTVLGKKQNDFLAEAGAVVWGYIGTLVLLASVFPPGCGAGTQELKAGRDRGA